MYTPLLLICCSKISSFPILFSNTRLNVRWNGEGKPDFVKRSFTKWFQYWHFKWSIFFPIPQWSRWTETNEINLSEKIENSKVLTSTNDQPQKYKFYWWRFHSCCNNKNFLLEKSSSEKEMPSQKRTLCYNKMKNINLKIQLFFLFFFFSVFLDEETLENEKITDGKEAIENIRLFPTSFVN